MKQFLLAVLATSIISNAQVSLHSLKSDFVLKENRETYKNQIETRLNSFLSKPITAYNEKTWISFFRELELSLWDSHGVNMIIAKAMEHAQSSGPKFQRAAIELAYTFKNFEVATLVYNIFRDTNDRQTFGTATHYLLNALPEVIDSSEVLNTLANKFPNYANDPILKFLHHDLTENVNTLFDNHSLINLFSHQFQENKTIIYSLHRKDRTNPGITVIKKPNGTFVRNSDGTIFHIQQLAASTSRLPGYLSQGNTPQGVFTIVGTYISQTESIGPTPNILTRIPFEVNPRLFYHRKNINDNWGISDYKNLLPESLKNYLPLYESYFAGMTGRRLIVMHGSTDDLSFFEDQPYYPLTPSKGCLTATEIWDENTGRLISSDQVKLMNAFHSSGNLYGFLLVVDIDYEKGPVTIEELLPAIKEAENSN